MYVYQILHILTFERIMLNDQGGADARGEEGETAREL